MTAVCLGDSGTRLPTRPLLTSLCLSPGKYVLGATRKEKAEPESWDCHTDGPKPTGLPIE